MVSLETMRKLSLAFAEADEHPHFEKTAFRVRKKIFATLDSKKFVAVLKLNEVDQSVFSKNSEGVIFPVPNKWGKQGWTHIELKKVRKDIFTDALTTAYCTVAPKTLAAMYRPE
jgi:hypothetical protein